MTLTHGGLFEGYGGTTQAAEMVFGELDTRWVSDIKPASIALLAHRHPDVPNLGDLTAIDFADVEPVDVLTASWPCQPFSSAGRRRGEGDHRALWPHVARAVAELRPRVFLGENVARIAGNGELRRAARTLAELGYVGAWRCVTAASVGAPHKRDRCFLVAVDAAATDTRGAEREGPGSPWSTLGRFPADPATDEPARSDRDARLTLLPTPTQNMTTGAGTSGRDGGMNLQTAATRLLPTPCVGDSRNTRNATARRSDGQEHHHAGETLCDAVHPRSTAPWGVYEPAIRRWETILGRPAPAPTQPSLRAPHGPQLSPQFVEWMMGLPAGWVTDVPTIAPRESGLRNAALSLLGDGVVPQQGAAAFAACLDELALRSEAAS